MAQSAHTRGGAMSPSAVPEVATARRGVNPRAVHRAPSPVTVASALAHRAHAADVAAANASPAPAAAMCCCGGSTFRALPHVVHVEKTEGALPDPVACRGCYAWAIRHFGGQHKKCNSATRQLPSSCLGHLHTFRRAGYILSKAQAHTASDSASGSAGSGAQGNDSSSGGGRYGKAASGRQGVGRAVRTRGRHTRGAAAGNAGGAPPLTTSRRAKVKRGTARSHAAVVAPPEPSDGNGGSGNGGACVKVEGGRDGNLSLRVLRDALQTTTATARVSPTHNRRGGAIMGAGADARRPPQPPPHSHRDASIVGSRRSRLRPPSPAAAALQPATKKPAKARGASDSVGSAGDALSPRTWAALLPSPHSHKPAGAAAGGAMSWRPASARLSASEDIAYGNTSAWESGPDGGSTAGVGADASPQPLGGHMPTDSSGSAHPAVRGSPQWSLDLWGSGLSGAVSPTTPGFASAPMHGSVTGTLGAAASGHTVGQHGSLSAGRGPAMRRGTSGASVPSVLSTGSLASLGSSPAGAAGSSPLAHQHLMTQEFPLGLDNLDFEGLFGDLRLGASHTPPPTAVELQQHQHQQQQHRRSSPHRDRMPHAGAAAHTRPLRVMNPEVAAASGGPLLQPPTVQRAAAALSPSALTSVMATALALGSAPTTGSPGATPHAAPWAAAAAYTRSHAQPPGHSTAGTVLTGVLPSPVAVPDTAESFAGSRQPSGDAGTGAGSTYQLPPTWSTPSGVSGPHVQGSTRQRSDNTHQRPHSGTGFESANKRPRKFQSTQRNPRTVPFRVCVVSPESPTRGPGAKPSATFDPPVLQIRDGVLPQLCSGRTRPLAAWLCGRGEQHLVWAAQCQLVHTRVTSVPFGGGHSQEDVYVSVRLPQPPPQLQPGHAMPVQVQVPAHELRVAGLAGPGVQVVTRSPSHGSGAGDAPVGDHVVVAEFMLVAYREPGAGDMDATTPVSRASPMPSQQHEQRGQRHQLRSRSAARRRRRDADAVTTAAAGGSTSSSSSDADVSRGSSASRSNAGGTTGPTPAPAAVVRPRLQSGSNPWLENDDAGSHRPRGKPHAQSRSNGRASDAHNGMDDGVEDGSDEDVGTGGGSSTCDAGRDGGSEEEGDRADAMQCDQDADALAWPWQQAGELQWLQRRAVTQQELMTALRTRGRHVMQATNTASQAPTAAPAAAARTSAGSGDQDMRAGGEAAAPAPVARLASMLATADGLTAGAFVTAHQFCRAAFALMRAVHQAARSLAAQRATLPASGAMSDAAIALDGVVHGSHKPRGGAAATWNPAANDAASVSVWDLIAPSTRYTLLHYAASVGCAEVVTRLVQAGATVDAESSDGVAADIALRRGYPNIARVVGGGARAGGLGRRVGRQHRRSHHRPEHRSNVSSPTASPGSPDSAAAGSNGSGDSGGARRRARRQGKRRRRGARHKHERPTGGDVAMGSAAAHGTSAHGHDDDMLAQSARSLANLSIVAPTRTGGRGYRAGEAATLPSSASTQPPCDAGPLTPAHPSPASVVGIGEREHLEPAPQPNSDGSRTTGPRRERSASVPPPVVERSASVPPPVVARDGDGEREAASLAPQAVTRASSAARSNSADFDAGTSAREPTVPRTSSHTATALQPVAL